MPNHLHGIVRIRNSVKIPIDENNPEKYAKADSLSVLVRTFKASVTKSARQELLDPPPRIWQRSFNDHILRDNESLESVRFYIESNPWRRNKEKDVH